MQNGSLLESQYVENFIRLVCVYIAKQATVTTNDDAVTAAFFFAEGIYTISPTEMCEYMHSRYGASKQLVLARILQEAIVQTDVFHDVIGETAEKQTDALRLAQQVEHNGVPYGDKR